jgi:PPOX class probable F420-dependent enzyme
MSVPIPDNLRDLLDRPITAGLATLMPDGQPQVTPVWVTYDENHVIINSARGRQKDRNMQYHSKVTLLLIDPDNADHWLELRGFIDEITEKDADDMIRQLAKKYRGKAEFDTLGKTRVTYKIALTKVNGE